MALYAFEARRRPPLQICVGIQISGMNRSAVRSAGVEATCDLSKASPVPQRSVGWLRRLPSLDSWPVGSMGIAVLVFFCQEIADARQSPQSS